MDSFELNSVLGECGINIPDKCVMCPRLGKLATTLSQARENQSFLIATTDTEVMAANLRAQLTTQVKERFPDVPDEAVENIVNNSATNFMGSEKHTRALKEAGLALEQEDSNIESTLAEISTTLDTCPPEGCSPVLPA